MTRVLATLVVLVVGLVFVEAAVVRGAHVTGAFALAGVLGGVVIVGAAKLIGVILQRPEDGHE